MPSKINEKYFIKAEVGDKDALKEELEKRFPEKKVNKNDNTEEE